VAAVGVALMPGATTLAGGVAAATVAGVGSEGVEGVVELVEVAVKA
jgi:hypothetical protein